MPVTFSEGTPPPPNLLRKLFEKSLTKNFKYDKINSGSDFVNECRSIKL